MRLTFLGTGPAEAIPRAGHLDAACLDAGRGGKSRRLRSSALVQEGGATILIDAGPDMREQLRTRRVGTIAAVFLTHRHSDAAGGVGWLPPEVPVYGPESQDPVRIGPLHIMPVPVMHSFRDNDPARGFVINGRLGYVSDCREIPPRSMSLLEDLEVLILDAAAYIGARIPTHLSIEHAVRLAVRLSPQQFILTQIGHTYPPHDLAERAVRRYAKTHGCAFPVRLAYDGLRVNMPFRRP